MQINAFNAGLSSLQNGQQRVERAAGEIAAAPLAQAQRAVAPNSADLAEQLLQLQQGKLEVQAGAKVMKTADEVLGTLIDIRA